MMRTLPALTMLWALCGAPEKVQEAAQPAVREKVGVVDLDVVYSQYKRHIDFKSQLEKEAEPYRKMKAEIEKLMHDWKSALRGAASKLTPEQREQGQRVLIDAGRKLEDLDFDFKKKVVKHLEDEQELQAAEIRDCIREYAVGHGLDVVFLCGEDPTPRLRKELSARPVPAAISVCNWGWQPNNHEESTDSGSAAKDSPETAREPKNSRPVFVSKTADLSVPIVEMLNARSLRSQKKCEEAEDE